MEKPLGWRVWCDDGSVWTSDTCEWADVPDGQILLKIIYYDSGRKQTQQADWYYEAPHPKGIIRAICPEGKKKSIEQRHPDAVWKEGFWTVDEWYREVVDRAVSSTWEDLEPDLTGYEGCCGD